MLPKNYLRRLACEVLEDRRLLSVGGGPEHFLPVADPGLSPAWTFDSEVGLPAPEVLVGPESMGSLWNVALEAGEVWQEYTYVKYQPIDIEETENEVSLAVELGLAFLSEAGWHFIGEAIGSSVAGFIGGFIFGLPTVGGSTSKEELLLLQGEVTDQIEKDKPFVPYLYSYYEGSMAAHYPAELVIERLVSDGLFFDEWEEYSRAPLFTESDAIGQCRGVVVPNAPLSIDTTGDFRIRVLLNDSAWLLTKEFVVTKNRQPTDLIVDAAVSAAALNPGDTVTISGIALLDYEDLGYCVDVESSSASIDFSGQRWTTPVVNGRFSRSVNIPSNAVSGPLVVTVVDTSGLAGSDSIYITVNTSLDSFGEVRAAMVHDIDLRPRDGSEDLTWTQSDERSAFSPSQEGGMMAALHLENIPKFGDIIAKIYSPDGNRYDTYTWTNPWDGSGSWAWAWWGWETSVPRLSQEGLWTVEWWYEPSGQSAKKLETLSYTYRYELTEHRTAGGVQDSLPTDLTNTFYQTDPRSYTWANFDRVSEALDVRWDFYAPDGSKYATPEHTTDAPPEGDYFGWTRTWGWIDIAGTSAADKTGQWRVDVSAKDAWGSFEGVYTDYFRILESPSIMPACTAFHTGDVTPNTPVEIAVNASDNTYLESVELCWRVDGVNQPTYVWYNAGAPFESLSETHNIGSFSIDQEVEYWAVATDTSGNRYEGVHHAFVVEEPDPPAGDVHIEDNAIWNNKVYISWQNVAHDPGGTPDNMVIDTWRVDDNGDGDPRNDDNRIRSGVQAANGILANLGGIYGIRGGATAAAMMNPDGSATVSLARSSDADGALETRYTIKPDDVNVYGDLYATPTTDSMFWWGIYQICGVWVANPIGEMATYDQISVDGVVHTARPVPVNAPSEEGLDYWESANRGLDYMALMSTQNQWATGMVLTDAPSELQYRGTLQMASQYGGWAFARTANVAMPEGQTLTAGNTHHFSAVFHADQDLSLDGFEDLLPGPQGWPLPNCDIARTNVFDSQGQTRTMTMLQLETTIGAADAISLTGDVDNDRELELVRVENDRLSVYDEQGALQVEVTLPWPGSLTMLDDVNGDGSLDIGIGGKQPNATTAFCNFYDGDGVLLKSFERSVGYDGRIYPLKVVEPGKILVHGGAGYSTNPRAMYVYDYQTATEDWGYDLGFASAWPSAADIDGDGRLEFASSWATVHNGHSANGTNDGQLFLTLTDNDGTNLLTQVYPSPDNGSANHILTDLDQDGTVDVLAIERHDPTYYRGANEVHLYGLDGSVLHTYTGPQDEDWLWAAGDVNGDGRNEVVVGGHSVLTVLDDQLQEIRSTFENGFVQLLADLTGNGTCEIVTVNRDNLLRVYDYELNLLDSIQLPGDARTNHGAIASDIDGDGIIELVVRSSAGSHVVAFFPFSAPDAPDLAASSDSGLYDDDNVTNLNTPTLSGTAPANCCVELYEGTTLLGLQQLVGGATDYSITCPTLNDGSHDVTVRVSAYLGATAYVESAACMIVVDTVAPAVPEAPALQATSDSGASSFDGITNDATPTFDVGSAGAYFRFYVDGVQASGNYENNASYTTQAQSDGIVEYAISAVDVAGNESLLSSALEVTIDTARPTAIIEDILDRPDAVVAIQISSNEPVAGLDVSDLVLTLNGTAVSLSGANVTPSDATLFAASHTLSDLSGLTAGPGAYELSLSAAGTDICDLAGNQLLTDATAGWRQYRATLTGTSQDDTIVVSIGAEHEITINSAPQLFDAAVITEIHINGLDGNDRITIYATPGQDTVVIGAARVDVAASTCQLHATNVEKVTVDAGMGEDEVTMIGSLGSNRLYSYADYSLLSDARRTYSYRAEGFESVTAEVPVGQRNYAFLYDSPGNDVLNAMPNRVELDCGGGSTTRSATGFERVYVYANQGGADTATLTGSAATANRFYSYADHSILTESRRSFYFYARGFDAVTANSPGTGAAYAYLYDSAGNDALTAAPASATMDRATGSSDTTATGFSRVYAYSTRGGEDTASLTGNADGGNYYRGSPTCSTLTDRARSFYHYARGFRSVTAIGSETDPSTDRAFLYDSSGDDTLYGRDNQCCLEDTAGATYHNEALYFDYVYARSTDNGATTDDTVDAENLAYFLLKYGSW